MNSLKQLAAILAAATLSLTACQRDREVEPADESAAKIVEPAADDTATIEPMGTSGTTGTMGATDTTGTTGTTGTTATGTTMGTEREATETAAQERQEGLDVDVEANDEAIGAEFEEERRQFVTATQRRIDQVESGLKELRNEASAASGNTKAQLEQEITELERERQELDASLERADETAENEWNEFERSVSAGVDELERGYNATLEAMKAD